MKSSLLTILALFFGMQSQPAFAGHPRHPHLIVNAENDFDEASRKSGPTRFETVGTLGNIEYERDASRSSRHSQHRLTLHPADSMNLTGNQVSIDFYNDLPAAQLFIRALESHNSVYKIISRWKDGFSTCFECMRSWELPKYVMSDSVIIQDAASGKVYSMKEFLAMSAERENRASKPTP